MSQAAALPDVIRDFERVDAAVVDQASKFPSSILADVAGRRGALHGRIAPLAPTMRFAGPALTVEVRPGDNLMIHAALAIVKPGDVIVVDGKGDLSSALMGEIMCQQAAALGVAAVVIDGAVRDAEAIRALGLPMYAAGLTRTDRRSPFPVASTIRSRSAASRCTRATSSSATATASPWSSVQRRRRCCRSPKRRSPPRRSASPTSAAARGCGRSGSKPRCAPPA